jgi:hypothetical protein
VGATGDSPTSALGRGGGRRNRRKPSANEETDMSVPMPPPPPAPKPVPAPIWKRLWFWVLVVMVVGAWVGAVSRRMSSDEGASADCLRPARRWLDTLQSSFNRKYRSAAITSSAYVHADTSEGTAYYVAVSVEGISGVAVFGTSDPPLQVDASLITAANPAAGRLFGSSWTRTGTSAESCL